MIGKCRHGFYLFDGVCLTHVILTTSAWTVGPATHLLSILPGNLGREFRDDNFCNHSVEAVNFAQKKTCLNGKGVTPKERGTSIKMGGIPTWEGYPPSWISTLLTFGSKLGGLGEVLEGFEKNSKSGPSQGVQVSGLWGVGPLK